MASDERISVIVTTYNWPDALAMSMAALSEQSDKNFEVIIADDGSEPDTRAVVDEYKAKAPFPIRHIWQPDHGFRAAQIRNKAIAQAKGEYIIFLDGDCLVRRDFVARYRALFEAGYFIVGNRVLLSEAFTEQVLKLKMAVYQWPLSKWRRLRSAAHCNRVLPMLRLPLGFLRKFAPKRWAGAKTCNLGVARSDLFAVNGFDERFEGWGYEDSDLVIRLINGGVRRKHGKFAVPVLHLWHPEHDRARESDNLNLLNNVLKSGVVRIDAGLSQHLVHEV